MSKDKQHDFKPLETKEYDPTKQQGNSMVIENGAKLEMPENTNQGKSDFIIEKGVRQLINSVPEAQRVIDCIIESQEGLNPEYQVWELKPNPDDNGATLEGCSDDEVKVSKRIDCGDLNRFTEKKFYVQNGHILLPSEY